MQYSVSITTYNRERKGRKNYLSHALQSYLDAGLLVCPDVASVDIFVGHEKDEWCEKTLPNGLPIHYLHKGAGHIDNIEAVFNHTIKDESTKYHLYLEDDLQCLCKFDDIMRWQMTLPNAEAFGVLMDYKPIVVKDEDRRLGYRKVAFNTFTAVMMYKNRIRYFMEKGGYPRGRRPDEDVKNPDTYFGKDHYFGKKVMQPTYTAVPSMFVHIGLESVAHKRCFDKPMGV